jgi:hypothetical protein
MAHLWSGRCTYNASWHTEVAKLLFRKKEASVTAPLRMTLPNEPLHRIAARWRFGINTKRYVWAARGDWRR